MVNRYLHCSNSLGGGEGPVGTKAAMSGTVAVMVLGLAVTMWRRKFLCMLAMICLLPRRNQKTKVSNIGGSGL